MTLERVKLRDGSLLDLGDGEYVPVREFTKAVRRMRHEYGASGFSVNEFRGVPLIVNRFVRDCPRRRSHGALARHNKNCRSCERLFAKRAHDTLSPAYIIDFGGLKLFAAKVPPDVAAITADRDRQRRVEVLRYCESSEGRSNVL